MAQSLADILALARKMFARERLPELEFQEAPRRAGPGVLRLLLGAEPLPFDPVPEEIPRGQGLVGRVFGREELPLDPVPSADPRRRRVLSLILGPEALPEDPPGPPRHRSRWFAWLFSREHIDPS